MLEKNLILIRQSKKSFEVDQKIYAQLVYLDYFNGISMGDLTLRNRFTFVATRIYRYNEPIWTESNTAYLYSLFGLFYFEDEKQRFLDTLHVVSEKCWKKI